MEDLLNAIVQWAVTQGLRITKAMLTSMTWLLQHTVLAPYSVNSDIHSAWVITEKLALSGVVLVIIYGALRRMAAGATGIDATEARDIAPRAVVAVLLILYSYRIVIWLLSANNAFVNYIMQVIKSTGNPDGWINGLAAVIGNAAGALVGITAASAFTGLAIPILLVFVGFAVVGFIAYLALLYYLRAAEIVFLLLLLPLTAAGWVLDESSGLWKFIFGELLAVIFQQSAQVLMFLAFFHLGITEKTTDFMAYFQNMLVAAASFLLMAKAPRLVHEAVESSGIFGRGGDEVQEHLGRVLGPAKKLFWM